MQKKLSFSELDQLETDHLEALLASNRLSDINRKLIDYEIRIRQISSIEINHQNNN